MNQITIRIFSKNLSPRGKKVSTSGFTLIEAMIVLVVLAIMLAVGVPSIMAIANRAGAQYASDELYGVLMTAKSRAIRFNTSCSVNFDFATNSYTRVCLDEAARGETGETVRLAKYRGNVQLVAAFGAAPATNRITFTPRGFAPIAGENGPVFIQEVDNDIWYRVRTLIAGATDVDRLN